MDVGECHSEPPASRDAAGTATCSLTAPVRVRFAPSPTGFLHVGSARTALFNRVFARSVGGKMLLRVEDTDASRNRPEFVDVIYDLLGWLGINWDDEPTFQSSRRDDHRAAVESLLAAGDAYLCDAENRPVDASELSEGLAVRFRMPPGGTVAFTDLVRGEVRFLTDKLEDFVIWRSDGTPTFLLANAVDDAAMGVTHVLRGEDLLSGTPKALLLLEALGERPPVYAHLPLLVNAQRKKLSKRRDDVSVAEYRSRGYLPEAMANYLMLLGWGPPDGVEIQEMDQIVNSFRLEDINKAPAFFDLKKLTHFNALWIRSSLNDIELIARTDEWLIARTDEWLRGEQQSESGRRSPKGEGEAKEEDSTGDPPAGPPTGGDPPASVPSDGEVPLPPALSKLLEQYSEDTLSIILSSIKQRVRTLADVHLFLDSFIYPPEPPYLPVLDEVLQQPKAAELLAEALKIFAEDAPEPVPWKAEDIHAAARRLADKHDLKLRKAQAPLRVAITKRLVGPPLFELMALLGRDEAMQRLKAARESLLREEEERRDAAGLPSGEDTAKYIGLSPEIRKQFNRQLREAWSS